MSWTILLTVVTGIILFIYGIENFSREVQKAAGDKLRKIIIKLTSNRFSGLFTGAAVTSLIQSSSATTVITVGLVNAGIISFAQSLAVMLGANIGTTVTAQLIAFKLTAFAPVFLIGGFLLSVFSKKYQYLGKGLFYFGLVFFSLNLVSTAIEPIKSSPLFIEYVSKLSNVFLALIVGIIFTAIVQSSSVTTGIVVILAASGSISLMQGIPLLLGANVGTTIKSFIASARLNDYAKRAAMAHFLFNLIGAIIFLIILVPFTNIVASFGGSVANQVANAHTIFNVITAIIFLIILVPFSKFIQKIIPTKEEEILLKTKYLNGKLPSSTSKAFSLIEKELKYSIYITRKAYEKSFELLNKYSLSEIDKLEKLESLNDLLDEAIESSLLELSKRKLDKKDAEKILLLIRISNAVEQLGDLADDLGNARRKIIEKGKRLAANTEIGIEPAYKIFLKLLQEIEKEFPKPIKKIKRKQERRKVKNLIQKEYHSHMLRELERKDISSSIFVESTSLLETSFAKIKEISKLVYFYNKV